MDTTGGGGCFAESIDDDRCYDLRDSHTHIITSLLRHRQSFDEDRERIYSIGVPSVCVPRATCRFFTSLSSLLVAVLCIV